MKFFSVRFRRGFAGLVIFFVIVSLTLGGCDAKEAAYEPITETDEAEQEQKIEPVTVTRAIYGTDIEITANPIQVKDGIAALEMEYKLIGEVDPLHGDRVYLFVILARGAGYLQPTNLRLIDFESGVVYQTLQRADNPGFPTGRFVELDEDVAYSVNALGKEYPVAKSITLFPAPENKSITVFVPNFGLISNVPVVQADSGTDFESYIKAAGEPVLDTIEMLKGTLREYLEDYSEEITIKKEGTEFTVTISSDVLFDTDKYDLNPEADEAINIAIEKIKASYDGGTVTIVGHTDDVASHEYNQTLSENRAKTVGAVIEEKLGSDFTIETLGRGETEPIAEGTSEEARAANRRVDIMFKGKTEETTETITNSEIPGTEMPTGSGNEWLEFSHGDGGNRSTYRVKALRIIRTEGALIGYFAFGTVSYGERHSSISLLGSINDYPSRELGGRGFPLHLQLSGAHSISLLTSEGRLFPYEYSMVGADYPEDERTWPRLLGDDRMYCLSTSDQGEVPTLLVTVIWPDTGQDEVTVDVKNRFRIENIEVDDNPEAINDFH